MNFWLHNNIQYAQIDMHAHTCMSVYMQTFTCIQHICISVFLHIWMYAHIHKHIHINSWICMHALPHTFSDIHRLTYRYIYTYICTYIHGKLCMPNTWIDTYGCLEISMHTYITHIFQPRYIYNF